MKNTNRKAFSLVELLFITAIISLLAALLFPAFARASEQARSAVCFSNMRQMGTVIQLYVQDYDETFPMNRLPDATHQVGGCKAVGTQYPFGNLEESRLNWRRVVQPYLKNKQVMVCPSNRYAWNSGIPNADHGDETNIQYTSKDYLPLSYAYNGNFFHEAAPACFYGELLERPRFLPEIDSDSRLIMLLESRLQYPDLGTWGITMPAYRDGPGPFQAHNGQLNFLFCDMHVKRFKLAASCTGKLWSDRYPDGPGACTRLDEMSEEYR